MIKLDNVVFNYQSMPMVFDLQIQAQEKIAIIGESGAGKSTLLNLIAGFEYADSGRFGSMVKIILKRHLLNAPFQCYFRKTISLLIFQWNRISL